MEALDDEDANQRACDRQWGTMCRNIAWDKMGWRSYAFRMRGDKIDYIVGSVWSWRGHCLVTWLDSVKRRREEGKASSRYIHNHEIGIADNWLDKGHKGEGTLWFLVLEIGAIVVPLWRKPWGTSLVVQWLRLCTSTAGVTGSIPDWETTIPRATEYSLKRKKEGSPSHSRVFGLFLLLIGYFYWF